MIFPAIISPTSSILFKNEKTLKKTQYVPERNMKITRK